MPPALSVRSVPLLAGLGGFHPSRVSLLPHWHPCKVSNEHSTGFTQSCVLGDGQQEGMENPSASSLCFRGLGTAGLHQGFWRCWPLSFKEGMEKEKGVKAVKGKKSRIGKGWMGERELSGCSPAHQEVVPSPCASRGHGQSCSCRGQRSGRPGKRSGLHPAHHPP